MVDTQMWTITDLGYMASMALATGSNGSLYWSKQCYFMLPRCFIIQRYFLYSLTFSFLMILCFIQHVTEKMSWVSYQCRHHQLVHYHQWVFKYNTILFLHFKLLYLIILVVIVNISHNPICCKPCIYTRSVWCYHITVVLPQWGDTLPYVARYV